MAKKLNIFRLENGYLLLVDRAQKATGGGGRGMKQHCSLIWERCHAGSRPFASFVLTTGSNPCDYPLDYLGTSTGDRPQNARRFVIQRKIGLGLVKGLLPNRTSTAI